MQYLSHAPSAPSLPKTGLILFGRLLFIFSLLAPTTVSWATDFGDRTPSVNEIIDALGSPSNQSGTIRNRGIKIVNPSQKNRGQPPSEYPESGGKVSMVIQFDLNSDRIQRRSSSSLSNLAAALSSETLKERRFKVIGHTDVSGSSAHNLKLSERRASAVIEYLSVHGIDRTRASASGRGSSELLIAVAPNSAIQRRVEIRIIQ